MASESGYWGVISTRIIPDLDPNPSFFLTFHWVKAGTICVVLISVWQLRCSEPVFVNLLRSPGIDSQPGGPVRHPYLSYLPAVLLRLAESIPLNRFLGSVNVYKFVLQEVIIKCYYKTCCQVLRNDWLIAMIDWLQWLTDWNDWPIVMIDWLQWLTDCNDWPIVMIDRL